MVRNFFKLCFRRIILGIFMVFRYVFIEVINSFSVFFGFFGNVGFEFRLKLSRSKVCSVRRVFSEFMLRI